MSGNSRAFDFVRTLAAKLGPELELPAFPDVVRRLQMALLDEQTSLKDVVNLIGSEPVLSARLMQMANSAALNPSGTPVASLNNAVSRLGFNLVRTVATAFALRQLSRDETLGEIRPELEAVWRTSNEVAAVCYGVARQSFGRQSDEAMMVGLLHSIGRLYIIMHAHKAEPALREDPSYQEMLGSWQPIIGRAILEAWGLPGRICDAVENQDALLDQDIRGFEPLTRLLAAAKLHHRLGAEPALRDAHPDADALLAAVNLGKGSFSELIEASQDDIAAIQVALAA